MAMVINGTKLAKSINAITANDIKRYSAKPYVHDFKPVLATVLVGADPASKMYVRMKQRKAHQVGISAINITLDSNISQHELDHEIVELNGDPLINGILVQLPLPKGLDAHKVADCISPIKDVDGFSGQNLGTLIQDRYDIERPTGCTPQGIITMLKAYRASADKKPFYLSNQLNGHGKKAVVIGRSEIVGRPLTIMLINHNYSVTCLNHYTSTKDLANYCKNADLIISATGHAGLITSEMVNSHAVLIDAGEDEKNGHLVGDITKEAKQASKAYSPVPHGVGPMTIATLMYQTVQMSIAQDKEVRAAHGSRM